MFLWFGRGRSELNKFESLEKDGSDLKEFKRPDEGWSKLNKVEANVVYGFKFIWLDIGLMVSRFAPSIFWGQVSDIIGFGFFLKV